MKKPIIVSFYMENIPNSVLAAQRRVMEKMASGFEFKQMFTAYGHARSMDYMMQDGLDIAGAPGVIFLDIDAIPLRVGSLSILWDMALRSGIAGAPQRSNHISNGQHIFVAPSIMAITKQAWERIGKPSAEPTRLGDVAESYTYHAEYHGIQPFYLQVLGYEKAPEPVRLPDGRIDQPPYWSLKSDDPVKYGLNTTFGFDTVVTDENDGTSERHITELFFHSFQSWAPGQQDRFITKCEEVLS